jgi:hypothetical protein
MLDIRLLQLSAVRSVALSRLNWSRPLPRPLVIPGVADVRELQE